MAITHYRFTFLPPEGTITVDGVPAVLNQWYDKNLVANFEKDPYDFGEPYTSCLYQVKNDDAISNVSVIRFSAPVDIVLPKSTDFDGLIVNSETLNFKDLMPIEDGVDRVKIKSFYTYGEILKNGSPIFPNTEIMRTDLKNTDYISPASGGGKPVQRIIYQVGNKNGYDPTEYKIDLSLISEADLVLISQTVSENVLVTPNIHIVKAELEIQKGLLGKIANLSFSTTLPAGAFPPGTNNTITINNTTVDTVDPFDFITTILQDGTAKISVLLQVEETDLPLVGDIVITLNDIDSDAGNVSITNSVTLNINL